MVPHSSTVRGTLSNPKTQKARIENENNNRTQLGDPGSLKAETTASDPVPSRTSQGGGNSFTFNKDSNPLELQPNTKNMPPSSRVRGTLSHPAAEKRFYTDEAGQLHPKADVNDEKGGSNAERPRSMLGDPTSLRAEYTDTAATENDRGAGPPGDEKELKETALKRKENEIESGKPSKL